MQKGTIQNITVALAGAGAVYYSWHNKKGLAMGSLIVIGSLIAGWIVGGYTETAIIQTK